MTDFAHLANIREKLKLSPNAMLAEGVFRLRTKKMIGSHSPAMPVGYPAHLPHVLTEPLRMLDSMTPEAIEAATVGVQIESSFRFTTDFPEAYESAKEQRPWGRIALTAGPRGIGASDSEREMMIELSKVLESIMEREDARGRSTTPGKPVLLAAYTAMSSGSYGSIEGRLVPVGIFNLDGTPLWLNPLAVARKIVTAPWPSTQRVQKITPRTEGTRIVSPAKGAYTWYPDAVTQVRTATPEAKGIDLVRAALDIRVDFLTGGGTDLDEARKTAYEQYKEFFTASGGDPFEFPWSTTPSSAKASVSKSKAKSKPKREIDIPKKPVQPAPTGKSASKKAAERAVERDLGLEL